MMNVCARYIDDSDALLRRMVRISSQSFHEEEVSSLIFSTLESWGLEPRLCGLNIVCTAGEYDPSLKTLVLDAHMDTVAPCAGWSRDPYDPSDNPEIIHGLGSNDDGGALVSMAAAFRTITSQWNKKASAKPINLVLAYSVEEEKSGPDGAVALYSDGGPREVREADWVIIGEPTCLKAATSERGLLVLDGYSEGVSAHAARGEGINALYIALEDIEKLRRHEFTKLSPTMGKVGLNVTQIEAGSAHNVIPDKCHFVVDIRPTEQYDNLQILNDLQAICKSSLKARNLTNRSSATFPDSPLRLVLSKLGIETFSSPTTSNWMRTGKDAIKIGPGDSSRSHRADEYLLRSELEEGARLYTELIETFITNC